MHSVYVCPKAICNDEQRRRNELALYIGFSLRKHTCRNGVWAHSVDRTAQIFIQVLCIRPAKRFCCASYPPHLVLCSLNDGKQPLYCVVVVFYAAEIYVKWFFTVQNGEELLGALLWVAGKHN